METRNKLKVFVEFVKDTKALLFFLDRQTLRLNPNTLPEMYLEEFYEAIKKFEQKNKDALSLTFEKRRKFYK